MAQDRAAILALAFPEMFWWQIELSFCCGPLGHFCQSITQFLGTAGVRWELGNTCAAGVQRSWVQSETIQEPFQDLFYLVSSDKA